jgi:hypothetical protein
MKGVIFNVVEEAVTEMYSADTWDDLLDAADLDGQYTALGSYDDADLIKLVGAACTMTGHQPDELVRVLGRHAFKHLAARHADLIDGASGTHEFLRQVNEIIHPEVLKLHPDATPPEFEFEDRPGGVLRLTYRSSRRLGALAEGLILGAGDRFGETVTVELISGRGEEVTVYDVHVEPSGMVASSDVGAPVEAVG